MRNKPVKPVEDCPVIAPEDLPKTLGKHVHVVGWNRGAVFIYRGETACGRHVLETPKTKRPFYTRADLYHTQRNAR